MMADLNPNGFSGQPPKTIQDFDPPKKPKRNKYALACCFVACTTSVLLGYDIGVMSGAIIYIQKNLNINDVQVAFLVSTLNFYSLLGSAAAGKTSDWIGRKYTIVFSSAIFFAGAILMGLAPNYGFLMFGRFVAGVGVGYGLMIAPVYTTEVAPASCRGFLTSFAEVFVNVGILLGYVSNYVFSKLRLNLGWRFMLGIGALPSIFLTIAVFFMPESPRWLVMQGRLGDAKKVLDRTSDSLEEAQLRLSDIKDAAGIPEHCNDEVVTVTKKNHGKGVWKELLIHPTKPVLHILICSVGIHFLQQITGIDTVVLYSPRILEKAGITEDTEQLLATMAVGFTKTMFILVATFFVDKVGRRPLLLSSIGGMVGSLVLLGIGLTVIDHSDHKQQWAVALCITMVLAYVAFFSIGIGPITWVYSAEIFPLRLRARGCSLGVAVNRFTSGIISLTFISLYKAITIAGAFFLYAGIGSLAFVFFYTLYPETQGRTIEDIGAMFGTFFKWRSTVRELKEAKVENKAQVQMVTDTTTSDSQS